jgi:hypothetical protein
MNWWTLTALLAGFILGWLFAQWQQWKFWNR